MASELGTRSEFIIVEKLGGERLCLLLDIAAELANYSPDTLVSIGDLSFDDRVADAEIGKSRVRDSLLLFQLLGLLEVDEIARTMRLSPALIAWTKGDADT